MLNLFSNIFGSSNDRILKKMMLHVSAANNLEEDLSKKSDSYFKDLKNDLSRNDLNIYLGNDMLTSITKALIVPISENKNVSILPDDWSSWSKGSISITEIGDTNNSSRKEIDSQGIAFGFDKKLNDDDIYGFSAHYGPVSYTHLTLPTNREV